MQLLSNPVLDMWIDAYVGAMLGSYFAPYFMPQLMGEVEQWTSSVSLNGARWSNLCKPN